MPGMDQKHVEITSHHLLHLHLISLPHSIARAKNNLHVVLAFSPIGDAFHERLRKFPALVNCCTINWFFSSINIFQSLLSLVQHEVDQFQWAVVMIIFHALVGAVTPVATEVFCKVWSKMDVVENQKLLSMCSGKEVRYDY